MEPEQPARPTHESCIDCGSSYYGNPAQLEAARDAHECSALEPAPVED